MRQRRAYKTRGLSLPSLEAGMGFARALTSHLRRRYRERYHARFRLAPWVFGFDVGLLVLTGILAASNIYLSQTFPLPADDLDLTLRAPELYSAKPLALEARVKNTGIQAKREVSIAWILPEGIELIASQPPIDRAWSAPLGELDPNEEVSARLTVRLLVPLEKIRIAFRVESDGLTRVGSITRIVAGSALELKPLIEVEALVGHASVPIEIRNASSEALEHVEIRILDNQDKDGVRVFQIGQLDSLERRVVLVRPSAGQLSLEARTNGRLVNTFSKTYQVLPRETVRPWTLELQPSTGSIAQAEFETQETARLLVYHPLLAATGEGYRIFEHASGKQPVHLRLEQTQTEPNALNWFALPIYNTQAGLGIAPAVSALVTTAFETEVAVRYYAVSGDQLGIGPLPPRVGQTTKYWVNAKIGPTTADLKDVIFRLRLASGVTATGQSALPNGGGFSQQDNEIVWSLPMQAMRSGEVSASFEIAFTPNESMRGKTVDLVESSSAEAVEMTSGLRLTSSGSSLRTDLPQDPKVGNQGQVD